MTHDQLEQLVDCVADRQATGAEHATKDQADHDGTMSIDEFIERAKTELGAVEVMSGPAGAPALGGVS